MTSLPSQSVLISISAVCTGLATSAIAGRFFRDSIVSESVTRLTVVPFWSEPDPLNPADPGSPPRLHRDGIVPAVHDYKTCLLSILKLESLLCQLRHALFYCVQRRRRVAPLLQQKASPAPGSKTKSGSGLPSSSLTCQLCRWWRSSFFSQDRVQQCCVVLGRTCLLVKLGPSGISKCRTTTEFEFAVLSWSRFFPGQGSTAFC